MLNLDLPLTAPFWNLKIFGIFNFTSMGVRHGVDVRDAGRVELYSKHPVSALI